MRKCDVKRKLISVIMLFVLVLSGVFATEVQAQDADEDGAISLVYQFAGAINEKDINAYIKLFTDEIQEEMYEYAEIYGNEDFFQEKSITLGDMKILSEETAIQSAQIAEELEKYEDVVVVYAEMNIQYNDGYDDIPEDYAWNNGVYYRNFVLVKQMDRWKIFRVSTPNIKVIVDNGEGFATTNEVEIMQKQEEQALVGNEMLLSRSALSCPISTTIYFTKSGNYGTHMGPRASIGFQTYLKNVIPNEWTVSYYGTYPAYLRAGAMGCKMYAWYYTIYPKWNFSPYYACMKDNSEDQNYNYSSYNELNSTYRGYIDSTLNDISDKAMVVSGTNNIFEVHYHATSGSYHSGQMSASGCLSKAKAGDSYETILHYYYDCSTYTSGKSMSITAY